MHMPVNSKHFSPYSRGIGLTRLSILYIATCGLYFFYWFYKTNQALTETGPEDKKAAWRTAGLIVPILNIYLLWRLFKDLAERLSAARLKTLPYPIIITLIFVVTSGLYQLPDLYSFLGFSSVFPVLYTQQLMNAYWQKEEGLPPRTKMNWIEVTICVLGLVLLALAVVGAGLTPSSPTPAS